MFSKTKVKARVLSKGSEEAEDPPLLGAFGGNSLLGLSSMMDESHSMWKRTTVYTVSFSAGSKTMEFFVDRITYDSLEIGDEGILVFSGDVFISFF